MKAFEIQAKTGLHFHKRKTATHWDLNIYRGCGHGCLYCFARYTHAYMPSASPADDSFFNSIFVKTNLPKILDIELSRHRWRGEAITLGGVCDSYQPLEDSCRMMPQILRVLIKHRNPVVISTKSTLIMRDIALFQDLAAIAPVDVGVSLCTFDPQLASILEPNASSPHERLNMLRAFRDVGCHTSVLMMPILPFITDSPENLERCFSQIRKSGASFVLAGCLRLRGKTRSVFMNHLHTHFPHLVTPYLKLYRGERPHDAYRKELNQLLDSLRKRYPIEPAQERIYPPHHRAEQIRMF